MKNLHRHRTYRARRILEMIRGNGSLPPYPSATRMAEELGVSWRTILRDLDYLRDDEGAPIEYDASRKGYYLTRAGWTLAPLTLTAREADALAMTLPMLQSFRGTPLVSDLDTVVAKIGAAVTGPAGLPVGGREPVSFIADDYAPIDPEIWKRLLAVVRNRQPVRMDYTTFANKAGAYEVMPVHVFAYHGNWYLAAFPRGKRMVATFAFSRVNRVEVLEEPGWAPRRFDPETYMAQAYGIVGGEKPIRVRVRVSPAIAAYMTERIWHAHQQVRHNQDGSAEIAFTTRGRKEVVRWVLSWQPDMEVLAPLHLRRRVQEKMTEALRRGRVQTGRNQDAG
ncbi:MAG TPA: YafY family protein [Kiritimatiellia bacterium]|nr:YafY family protein [Kiritimatiellia bacterium]HMP35653.1 YafY family protein [Kiritimatiellia bacterium]